MPSPFPGMNPFLEQDDVWQDFHLSLMPLVREMLSEQVRPNYVVKVEEYLFIHELPADERRYLGRADVAVSDPGSTKYAAASTAVAEAPAYGRLPAMVDIERHAYVEIRDRRNRELITIIEVLSPANKKPGPDREAYLAKRRQILVSNVHLVEIDLLRGGPRLPLDDMPECAYCALVSQVEKRPVVGIWPIQLCDPLPTLPIPLRTPDPHASLDLQQALHRIYDAAGYEDYLYTSAPQPPLTADEAEWSRQWIPNSFKD